MIIPRFVVILEKKPQNRNHICFKKYYKLLEMK